MLPHISGIQLFFDSLFLPVQNHPVDLLLRRHSGGRIFLLDLRRGTAATNVREVLDEALQGSRSFVEDQIVGHLALFRRNLRVGPDMRRIDDRRVEPRLHAVVEEYRVENAAGVWS